MRNIFSYLNTASINKAFLLQFKGKVVRKRKNERGGFKTFGGNWLTGKRTIKTKETSGKCTIFV